MPCSVRLGDGEDGLGLLHPVFDVVLLPCCLPWYRTTIVRGGARRGEFGVWGLEVRESG
jgi:hypothetical protein